jgi:hypothetical protein
VKAQNHCKVTGRAGAYLLLAASVGITVPCAFTDSLQVTIGTSVLSGTSGTLAFDFIDSDGLADNSVSIVNFASDATLSPGIATGSESGDLPGTVTLTDAGFFNELLVPVTFGSSISFNLDYSNVAGAPPDSFTFFLLDPTAFYPLVTTDLLGDALLEVDMTGGSAGSVFLPSTVTPAVTISLGSGPPPPPPTVPEPASFPLIVTAIAAAGLLSRKRSRNRSNRRRLEC